MVQLETSQQEALLAHVPFKQRPWKYRARVYIRHYRPIFRKIDPWVMAAQNIYWFGLLWLISVILFADLEARLTNLPNWTDGDVFTIAKLIGLIFGAVNLVLSLVKNHRISLLAVAFGLGALGVGEFGDIAMDFASSKAPELKRLATTSVSAQMICGGLILAGLLAGAFQLLMDLFRFFKKKHTS